MHLDLGQLSPSKLSLLRRCGRWHRLTNRAPAGRPDLNVCRARNRPLFLFTMGAFSTFGPAKILQESARNLFVRKRGYPCAMMSAAATLHAQGKTEVASAAEALGPIAGDFAFALPSEFLLHE